ncbi:MAG TPA: phosphatidylglycerol lysyltransferase domain-containing protein, partial [Armatimonadota bacterium]|nr:phosphatidylglycerol lysyltransferase domain-containing protein [Armatimonadota bacterium]
WVLDLMRRRDDAFSGVMEFLIAKSALAFKEEGAQFISLAVAPLARVERPDCETRLLERLLSTLGDRLDTFYSFSSLFEFKRKFQPSWLPVYLAYPGAASLPKIGYAVLRAYLPTLSVLDARLLLSRPVPHKQARVRPESPPVPASSAEAKESAEAEELAAVR